MAGRRDLIKLSQAEQLELLESQRVVIVSSLGPRGWPHSMPMWFTLREPAADPHPEGPPLEIWIWTYAKSQKVRNLERDPRATLLVETGTEYLELRGMQIEAEAELIRDTPTVAEFGKELAIRYAEGIDAVNTAPQQRRTSAPLRSAIGGDAAAALEAQAAKRVAIRFQPVRVASWDHRKLGGTY